MSKNVVKMPLTHISWHMNFNKMIHDSYKSWLGRKMLVLLSCLRELLRSTVYKALLKCCLWDVIKHVSVLSSEVSVSNCHLWGHLKSRESCEMTLDLLRYRLCSMWPVFPDLCIALCTVMIGDLGWVVRVIVSCGGFLSYVGL